MDEIVPTDKLTALITGLRDLADVLEKHPDIHVPQDIIINNPVGPEDLTIIAIALGVEVETAMERTDPTKVYDQHVDIVCGPIKLHSYDLDRDGFNERMARMREAEAIAKAARWVWTCDAHCSGEGYPHATERDAKVDLSVHIVERDCPAAHEVKLVSGETVGSTR